MDFPIHPASAGADDGAGLTTDAGVERDADAGTGGPSVERLAIEVLSYPERNPLAVGGLEDIARWWIATKRLEDTLLQVEHAVLHLVTHGLIEAVCGDADRMRDGRRIDAAPVAACGPLPTGSDGVGAH